MLKGVLAVILALRFCNGWGLGSPKPNVMVSVKWHGHAEPSLWLEGVSCHVATKSWNSLIACFYGRVSRIQHKTFRGAIYLVLAGDLVPAGTMLVTPGIEQHCSFGSTLPPKNCTLPPGGILPPVCETQTYGKTILSPAANQVLASSLQPGWQPGVIEPLTWLSQVLVW